MEDKIKIIKDLIESSPNDICWDTGNYTDLCDCELCSHKSECSGYDKEDD